MKKVADRWGVCGDEEEVDWGLKQWLNVNIFAKLRHEVFKRDNYRCRECGATNKETTLEIDHIVPVSKVDLTI